MNKKFINKTAAVLMTTAMTLSVSSVAVFAEAKDVKEGGLTFGVTYWIESDFFKTIAGAIEEAAEADGNSVTVVNGEQDSAKQIQIIEDFITKGVDAAGTFNPYGTLTRAEVVQFLYNARLTERTGGIKDGLLQ